jgi:Flp pilus assembly pilin Flp
MGRTAFLRDTRGVSSAEFALILPLLLVVLLGSIDVGRYSWSLGQAQKATQIGARVAVVTDMVPSDLYTYSFATSGGIPQGTTVPAGSFPTITCQTSSGTPGCACPGNLSFCGTASSAAFNRIATRMAQIYPGLTASNVVVTYAWSGLGFSGDPNGADVAPLVTVSLRNVQFVPFTTFIFGTQFNLPQFAYSLPMEDGSGSGSN